MLQTSTNPIRFFSIGSAFLSAAGLTFAACSEPQVVGGSTGAGGAQCANIFISPDDCGRCALEQCCAEVAACHAVDNCIACYVQRGVEPPCNASLAQSNALAQCARAHCTYECYTDLFCVDGGNASDGGGCIDTEPDGGVTFAECQGKHTTIIRGTLNGKPIDETYPIFAAPSLMQTFTTPFHLSTPMGWIDLFWQKACLYPDGAPVRVTGTAQIAGQSTYHTGDTCSLLWKTRDQTTNFNAYRFNLLFTNGDQLTGCTQ